METTERVSYDGKAFLGLALALGALAAFSVPLLSAALAIAAIVVALMSRKSLHRNPALAGAGVSVVGFLLAAVVLLLVAIPQLISIILHLVDGSLGRIS